MSTSDILKDAKNAVTALTSTGDALRTRLLWLVTETSVDIHTAVYAD